jgi:hypothetical protein
MCLQEQKGLLLESKTQMEQYTGAVTSQKTEVFEFFVSVKISSQSRVLVL